MASLVQPVLLRVADSQIWRRLRRPSAPRRGCCPTRGERGDEETLRLRVPVFLGSDQGVRRGICETTLHAFATTHLETTRGPG